jgi:hypothetical protein
VVSCFTRGNYAAYDILFRSVFISFCFLLGRYCGSNHFVIIPQAGVPTRVGTLSVCSHTAHPVAPLPRERNCISSGYETLHRSRVAVAVSRRRQIIQVSISVQLVAELQGFKIYVLTLLILV